MNHNYQQRDTTSDPIYVSKVHGSRRCEVQRYYFSMQQVHQQNWIYNQKKHGSTSRARLSGVSQIININSRGQKLTATALAPCIILLLLPLQILIVQITTSQLYPKLRWRIYHPICSFENAQKMFALRTLPSALQFGYVLLKFFSPRGGVLRFVENLLWTFLI